MKPKDEVEEKRERERERDRDRDVDRERERDRRDRDRERDRRDSSNYFRLQTRNKKCLLTFLQFVQGDPVAITGNLRRGVMAR